MKPEIIAKVKFNDGIAIVIKESPKLVFKKEGDLMWGTDGLFYTCYENQGCGKTWKAFAGRKFEIPLENGEVEKCYGQWWDAGQTRLSKNLNIRLGCATVGVLEKLKKCYVYCGYNVDFDKYQSLLVEYSHLPVFPYRDYEKVIKYDDMRKKHRDKISKLERKTQNLILEVKKKHKEACRKGSE